MSKFMNMIHLMKREVIRNGRVKNAIKFRKKYDKMVHHNIEIDW